MALKIRDNAGTVVKVPSMKEVNDRITARIQDPAGLKTINGTVLYGSGNLSLEPAITAGSAGQYWGGLKTWQTPDSVPTAASTQLITSGAVYAEIANLDSGKQDEILVNGILLGDGAGGVTAAVGQGTSAVVGADFQEPLPVYSAHTSGFYKFSTNALGQVSSVANVTKSDLLTLGVADADNLVINLADGGTDGTDGDDGLMSMMDKFRLDGMEDGAQENVIESISIGGVAQSVDALKNVNLPAYPVPSNATITINSSNTTSQTPGADTFTLNQSGGTTIQFHEIAKTGDYGDLLNTPDWQDVLDLQTNKLNKTFASDVKTTVTWSQTASAVSNTVSGVNPSTGAVTGPTTTTLQSASASQIGLMTAGTFQALEQVILDVDTLKGASARYLIDLDDIDGSGTAAVDPMNPTQGELQTAYETSSGLTGPANDGVILVDPNYSLSYQWFGTSTQWVRLSAAQIQIATTTSAGIVLSTDDDMATTALNAGKVFVELNGSMSVIGWDVLESKIDDTVLDLDDKQDKLVGTSGNVITFGSSAGLVGSLAIDSVVTSGSSSLISSGAVHSFVGNGTLVINLVTDDGLGTGSSVNNVATLNFAANQSGNATPLAIPVPLDYVIGSETGDPEDDWTT